MLTVAEAAELLGVSTKTLRRWDQAGKLRASRHPTNAYRLYLRDDVIALAHTLGVATPEPELVGRAALMSELEAYVRAGPALVSLVGTPGIGKSALARLLALRRTPSVVVDLVDARTPDDVSGALAAALGCPVKDIDVVLARKRPALVVLDDADAVVTCLADAVRGWRATLPSLNVVTTAREPLALDAERVVEVRALALADARALYRTRAGPDAREDGLDELLAWLDYVPLAIELAAARASVLGPRALLSRLEAQSEQLRAVRRDRPPRHASMDAAVAASWALCGDEERRALARLTVFRGGFELPAAEAVIGTSDAAQTLESLRRRSLLRVEAGRFQLYQAVRAYATAQLDDATREAAEEAHAAYFVGHADETMAPRERENLIAVIERRGPTAEGAAALLVVGPFLLQHGPIDRLRRAIDRVLGADVALPSAPRLLALRGRMRGVTGDTEGADADLRRALAWVSAGSDARLEGEVHREVGWAFLLERGDLDAAKLSFDRALECARSTKNPRLEAQATTGLATALTQRGDLDVAHRLLRDALAAAGAHALFDGQAHIGASLGLVELARGELDEAARLSTVALERLRSLGLARAAFTAETNLARILVELGDQDAAERAIAEAERRGVGARLVPLLQLARAWLSFDMGDVEGARGAVDFAIRLAEDSGVDRSVLYARFDQALLRFFEDGGAATALEDVARELDRVDVPAATLARIFAAAAEDDGARMDGLLATLGPRTRARVAAEALRSPLSPAELRRGGCRARLAARWRARRDGSAPKMTPDGVMLADRFVDLSQRAVLWRVCAALVEHVEGLTTEGLLQRGWPEERLRPERARHRVHGAVRELRKLGLHTLRHVGDRYVLAR